MQSPFRWGNTGFPLKIFILFASIPCVLSHVFGQINPGQHTIQGNYRLAAVRVQFQKDTVETTTGNGQFDLSASPAGADTLIDPSPHNKAYFEAQIQALNNYYSTVSHGMVTVDSSAVFPAGNDAAYTLSEPMLYYSRSFVDSVRNKNWGKLVYDVYLQAQNDINYANFSTLVIFHAGVGQDFSIPLDDTPFDIQSAYLDASFLQENLSGDQWQQLQSAGIEHVLILPETQNQLDIKLGVTGTFALLFGSRIGLPSLYNTSNGKSVIGKFGLMDQGSANANGVAPAPPSAWTKIYAGWDSPESAAQAGQYTVRSPEVSDPLPTIVKVPINNTEYYLIENRQRQTRESNLEQFIIGIDTLYVQRQSGVITKVDEYDAGLPGDGLLIWHIDESVIQDSIGDDAINNNLDRRGVDLEEADGAQDLGQYYGPLSGGIENGWFFDYWFAGNLGFFDLNPNYPTDSDSTIGFTPETHPSTLTNSGAYSGIAITKIPDASPAMSFNLQFRRNVPGFPLDLQDDSFSQLKTVQNGTNTYLVMGSARVSPVNKFVLVKRRPGNVHLTTLEVTNPGYSESQLQSIAVFPDDAGGIHLIYSTELSRASDHKIFTNVRVASIDSSLSVQFAFNSDAIVLPGSPLGQVIYKNGSITVATNLDTVYNYSSTGALNWKSALPATVQSLAANSDDNYFVGTDNGLFIVSQQSVNTLLESGSFKNIVLVGGDLLFALQSGNPIITGTNSTYSISDVSVQPQMNGMTLEVHSLTAADPDGDGAPEALALASNSNNEWMLIAWNPNGSLANNFPIYLNGTYQKSNISLVDIDGDNVPEYFVNSDDGKIYGFSPDGRLLLHYPIDTGGQIAAPIEFSATQGGRMTLFSLEESSALNGYYSVVDPEVHGSKVNWTGANGNPANTRFMPEFNQTVTPGASLAIRRAYIYPNPVQNDHGTIRVEAENAEHISVSIFDFSGRFINKIEAQASGSQTVYEFPWDASQLPSGVYFGNVVVKKSGQEETKTIKIAVVR